MTNTDFLITFGTTASAAIAEMRALEAQALRTQRAIDATATSNARTAAAGAQAGTAARAFAQLDAASTGAAASQSRVRAETTRTDDALQRHATHIGRTVLLYGSLAAAAAGASSAIQLASTIDTESRRLEAVLGLDQRQGSGFVRGVFQTAIATATPVEDLLSESDLVASAFAGIEDAAERTASSQALLNRVGQITTVTQRDVATETQNLIALLQLGELSVDGLGDALGRVVVAGNNSSTSIAAILDAVRIALPGAKLAGVSLEQLIALTGLFRQETQRSGVEIGSTFATLFQTITNEKAQNNIKDITDGLVDVRDAAGNLRPAIEILAQIRSLIDEGAIAAEKLPDIFKAFAPPLNPGAAKDVALIFELIGQLPAELREVEQAGGGALDGLVTKLNQALGPQFRILVEQTKAAFNELFGDDLVAGGQTLISTLRDLGRFLGDLPPDVLRAVAAVVGMAVAIKGATFAGGALVSLLGVRGILGGLQASATAAAAAGTSMGFFSASVAGATAVMQRFLPLILAWAAIDFAQQVGNAEQFLRSTVGGLAEGNDLAGLKELRGRLQDQFNELNDTANGKNLDSPFDLEGIGQGVGALFARGEVEDSIKEVDRLIQLLVERGPDAVVTAEDLGAAFSGQEDISEVLRDAYADQADALERLFEQYRLTGQGLADMTLEERTAAEAAQLLEATRESQAADLERLAERLREGKISAEEFAQGQQIVQQASELAAQLVAIAGEQLAQYPLFAAAAAEGNEALTEKVYEMIVASGGSINAIAGLIGQLGNLAAANAAVSSSLASNPLVVRIAVSKVSSADLAANPELSAARRFAQNAIAPSQSAESQINAILDSINDLIGGFGSGTSAFGNIPKFSGGSGGGAGGSGPKPTLFDLDDFPAEKLAQAIALAQRLQASIPGASKEAKDEVLNIIKDTQFLRTIKGLDDQLLRKAIERLTEVEEARLEEERRRNQANEILQNLNVRAGPLGALISQPTLFGVGGSIPAGLNFDPQQGDFTINIPVELKGLEPAQLQALIYAAVVKAIKEGIRLSP